MPFDDAYPNMVSEQAQAHTRMIRNYDGGHADFDFIVIGSGMGGGILADDLADRVGSQKRILVLDAGSFIYPTHVYNCSRIPNSSIARHFGADSFWQYGDGDRFIGEKPQMAFGGRSVFWSGLIPEAQSWELEFFPPGVRDELTNRFLDEAAKKMNESVSLGPRARELVSHFRSTDLAADFDIEETPRAVHQPYLKSDGTPADAFFTEPTGVFNTAELLINQVGLTHSGIDLNGNGLFIRLNAFVEAINEVPFDWYEVRVTDTVSGQSSSYYTPKVVLAGGVLESPKLMNRSSIYQRLPQGMRRQIGFGLTDHPVTSESQAYVSSFGTPSRPLSRRDHAKIVFYSKGLPDGNGNTRFPFNVEMNVNHEFWHLRNNDSTAEPIIDDTAKTRVDIKFSFANCLDDENGILSRADDGYVPEVRFKRFSDLDDLLQSRFPAMAGWSSSRGELFGLLNSTRNRIFSHFNDVDWITGEYGEGPGKQWPFGWGTVHHACGTLRMPWRSERGAPFDPDSVVDEDLKVRESAGMYVCDMSVMPFSTAANPVRTLAGLALRLSDHLT